MSESPRAYADAVAAMVRRDMLTYLSYRLFFISQIFQAFFSLTLFYYVSRLVTLGEFESPDRYYAFVVVGLVVMQVLTSAMALLPTAVRQELVSGTFERVLISPFGPVGAILSMAVFPLLTSLILSMLTVVVATAIFGLPLHGATAALSIPVAILGAAAFVPFGILITALVVTIKQAANATSMVIALLSLVGGFFFPVRLLPDWIEWTSDVQPFTPALDLIRHLLVDLPLAESAWVSVGKMALFAAILFSVSIFALSRAIALARRRGTIMEY